MGNENAAPAAKVEVVQTQRVMTIAETQALEKEQSRNYDYYAVFLKDDVTGQTIRVRTTAYYLDEERKPVLDDKGRRQRRNPHDVALNVWAAYGADDHTLEMVQHGALVVATPQSIATELGLATVKPPAEPAKAA